MWHSRVCHPDLRLEGTLGDRYEAGQKHIVDVHGALTNPPPILDGSVQSKLSDIVEVPIELLGDLVGKFAARYRQAVPSPVHCMNLRPRDQYAVA